MMPTTLDLPLPSDSHLCLYFFHTLISTSVRSNSSSTFATMLAAALLALPALASFASAATHTVVVGGTGLIYTPSELVAAVGDQVTFVFGCALSAGRPL